LQYIAEIEGKDNTHNKDNLSNTFAILFSDIINKDTPYSSGFNSKTLFTLIKGFTTKLVVLYAKTLVNSFNN
jgi:hypothetical protein